MYIDQAGALRKVSKCVRRGKQIKCLRCALRGATLGCRLDRCKCSYHLHCAEEAGCTFFADFTIGCPSHTRMFKNLTGRPCYFEELHTAVVPAVAANDRHAGSSQDPQPVPFQKEQGEEKEEEEQQQQQQHGKSRKRRRQHLDVLEHIENAKAALRQLNRQPG